VIAPFAAADLELPEEEQITAAREETKYRLEPEQIGLLMAELTRRLPSHRFLGEGANRLPDPHHYVTTVYFDTPDRNHLEASRRDRNNNVKVRARDYYDVHPSLAEIATQPGQVIKYTPWVFFEVKRREGTRTEKERFRLPRAGVVPFVERLAEGTAIAGATLDATQPAEVEAPLRYLRDLKEPLTPCCLVNYRRVSWQQADLGLRVTLDLGIAFYRPPHALWQSSAPLIRSSLGQSRGYERCAVLEVKCRGASPEWLAELLARARVERSDFSKFLAAMEAVIATGG
jgi:hypothetical protein